MGWRDADDVESSLHEAKNELEERNSVEAAPPLQSNADRCASASGTGNARSVSIQ